jgi:predicted extracellular nuclease
MPARLLLPALIAAAALAAPASAWAVSDTIVISEVQFRGIDGNDEFVELRNVSSVPQGIGGWELQGCAAASGAPSRRVVVPAGTTVPAGGAYLFANASGRLASVADLTYSVGLSDDGGVRIFNGAAAVDGVANQDSSADQCREGTGLRFPTDSGPANAFERTQDTDNNVADFAGPKAPDPQGSKGDVEIPPPALVKIHEVQGPDAASTMGGRFVTIEGIVTGVDDEIGSNFERTFPGDAGIFVQEEDSDVDSNPATSEGVFVGFVRPRSAFPPGTRVRLEGRVAEQFNETRINLTLGTTPEVLGTAAVPAPVPIDVGAAAGQSFPERTYYESLEGMNVALAVGTATVGGTNKFGELFMTPGIHQQPSDRVFRTENPADLIAADADAGAGDPDNPLIDTDSLTEIPADLFDVVDNVVGPLGFAFSNYRILNQLRPQPQPVVTRSNAAPYPFRGVDRARGNELRFATYNVENFFPVGGDVDRHIVTEEEYRAKRNDIVKALRNRLKRPDVIALQEIVDKATADDLARKLGGYRAYLEEGNDSRGIDVAFLVKKRLRVHDVRQLGKEATTTRTDCADSPSSGGQPRLFDRPPLAIDVSRRGVRFTAFSNHFASKSHPDACREEQARFLRDEVQRIEAAGGEAIVAGDLNSFEDEVALDVLEDGTTSLDNLWDLAPEFERYSFVFQGRLQTLDHVLVTDGLAARVEDFDYVHLGNDYYDRRTVDGHDASDHDPALVTFQLPPHDGDSDSDSDSDD